MDEIEHYTMQFTNSEQRLFCPEVPTTKRSSFWIVFIIMIVGHLHVCCNQCFYCLMYPSGATCLSVDCCFS